MACALWPAGPARPAKITHVHIYLSFCHAITILICNDRKGIDMRYNLLGLMGLSSSIFRLRVSK